VQIGLLDWLKVAIQSIWWLVMSKREGLEGMFDGRHFDPEIIVLCVRWYRRCKRAKVAAKRFFEKTIGQNGSPKVVTIDKSSSNLAALHAVNAQREKPIKVRQVK
jgi:transposase-like protein